ncbi:MAG: EpsI family protein [Gammaproteobacteria bacterium]|nr:EpsI family protein [Gammaproteobacteria bacterium]
MDQLENSGNSVINISALAVITTIVMIFTLYQTTVLTLYELWITSSNVTYTHGSLLFLVCIYLFVSKWRLLGRVDVNPSYIGFSLLSLTSLTWFLTGLADILIAVQLLIPVLIMFSLWTLFGYRVFREFLFPVMLIVCAIPVWEIINEGWLQKITATGVSSMLEVVGISNYREGVHIYIPVGIFRVAENCSGMRQLVAAITIAVIYSYINHFRIMGMIAYTMAAVVLSVIINMTRIFIVVVSGQLTNMQHYFVREDHVTLGWVLFGIGIFIFIFLSNKVFDKGGSKETMHEFHAKEVIDKTVFVKGAVLIIIGIGIGPLLLQYFISKNNLETSEFLLPGQFKEWQLISNVTYDYQPHFLAASNMYSGIYKSGNDSVYCHISYYEKQEQGNELISSLNKISDDKIWIIKSREKYSVHVNKENINVDEVVINSLSGKSKVIWRWYYVSGNKTSSPIMAKLLGIWGVLKGDVDSASVVLATEAGVDISVAREKLERFLNESIVPLESSLGGVSKLSE